MEFPTQSCGHFFFVAMAGRGKQIYLAWLLTPTMLNCPAPVVSP